MNLLKKKQLRVFHVLVACMAIIALGCDSNRVFDENKAIPGAYWEKEFKPVFNVEIKDTTTNFEFYINVRNTEEYRYSNLYVFLETHFPNGNLTRDTIECMLADISGYWLGHSSGNLIEHQIMLNPTLRFPLTGNYTFEIEQAMRESLQGITDIGIRIEKSR